MQTKPGQPKRSRLLRAFHLMILCWLAQTTAVFGLNFDVPLASLTNHNTSACANYSPQFGGLVSQNFGSTSVVDTSGDTISINPNLTDMSLNPVTPGHVSHVDVHTLIPKRPDLRWFANGTCWWGEGPSHHIDNGTTNTTPAYAAAMVTDLESRGFNGLIFSWYGKGDQTDVVAQNVQKYLASAANTNKNFTFIIMIVFGYFSGGDTVANVESNINYCQNQYFSDVNYEKDNGHPLLMFFNVRSSSNFSESDMDTIKAATSSNTLWVDENTTHISESWVDMTYQWTDDYEEANTNFLASSTPYNLSAVTNDFSIIKSYSNKPAFGAMCAHFNGTLTKSASWSLGKYLPSGNGLCEFYRAQEINQVIPTNMTRMQWATWSDYEEGTEVEVGTENYFALTTSLTSSNLLTWTITAGDERTIDHYEVYAVTNGGNAAFLGTVANGIHQSTITQLAPGNYQLYVDAIGLPCIRDHLSTPVTYTGQPQTLPPPWISQDIGSPGVGGSASYTNGIYTVNGSGVDIWGTGDSFQFVYQPWIGDGQIVARVVSMQDTASAAKAGLMFRETLSPGSAQGDFFVTPTSGISLQGRTVAGVTTSNVMTAPNLIAPYWLSLIRTGNVLSGYESLDGVNWTLVGTNVYSMAKSIYVGLCVTSKSNTILNAAMFDHVAVGASTVVGQPVSMVNISNYTSSLKITFDGYNRPETLNNFPALVRLGTNVPGFSYAQFAMPTGNDLRFTVAGSAIEIPYEINQWNTNGISTVWVQMPTLSGTNDAFMAYWGNPSETNAPSYTTNGAVWVPNASASSTPYNLVYHLEQNGFPYFDSALQYPATNGIAPSLTNGIVGAGDYFGRASYLDAGSVNLGNVFTLSAWVNVSSSVSDIQCIWANGSGVAASAQIFLYVNDYKTSDGALVLATGNGSTAGNLVAPAGSVSLNQWHLVTAVVDRIDGAAQLYVDGNVVAAGPIRNDFPNGNDLELGRDTGGTFAFLGSLDEARIHSSLESSNWVWASYQTVAANSTFENYSAVNFSSAALTIQNSGGNVILAWPSGTLQSAGQIAGPYSDIPGATSPYTNILSGTQLFFRIRNQ